MRSLGDAALDVLVAGRQTEECGGICLVTVPGWSDLSPEQKARVAAKVDSVHSQDTFDASALDHALRLIPSRDESAERYHDDIDTDISTPPPNPEEFRAVEARARSELEADGGLPCYPHDVHPPDLNSPFREVPDEYRDIIYFWTRQDPQGHGKALLTQLRHWEGWRQDQVWIREQYGERSWKDHEDAVHRRRTQFGVAGNVRLQHDPAQQSRLDSLAEYQDYNFRKHLQLKRDLAREEKGLEDHPHEADTYRYRIGSRQEALAAHDILLRWIEQKRTELQALRQSCIVEGERYSDPVTDAVQTHYGTTRLKRRQLKTRATLGMAGISKHKQRRRTTRLRGQAPQTCLDALTAVDNQSRPTSPVSILQVREPQANEPQGVGKTALDRLHSRKAVRVKELAATVGLRSRREVSQLAVVVKTRSGRVSKKPVRWL